MMATGAGGQALDEMLDLFEALALEAGAVAASMCTADMHVEHKDDASPVTKADGAAEAIILDGLARHFANIPVIAEEAAAAGSLPDVFERDFFLVDPLDGTKEFVAQRQDYTVNIAFIIDGSPVGGVVYAPARHLLYRGGPAGAQEIATDAAHAIVSRRPIRVRGRQTPPVIVASRSHRTPETDSYITGFQTSELVSIGSSLKFCMIARGDADIYPRFGPTMQWDTAAGDAVLRAAGGKTHTPKGEPLTYGVRETSGRKHFGNPSFIAEGAVLD